MLLNLLGFFTTIINIISLMKFSVNSAYSLSNQNNCKHTPQNFSFFRIDNMNLRRTVVILFYS